MATAAFLALCGSNAEAKTTPVGMQTAGLSEGRYVLPPIAFTQFCLDYPQECQEAGGAKPVKLTRRLLAQLRAVNRQVNKTIAPSETAPGPWALDVAQGDCNNYAVQKRHELLKHGWPAGDLALTVVRTPWGEGHLVLTVRTSRGDLVLDNLRADIRDWRRSEYEGLMRQSAENPKFWVSLETPVADTPLVAKANDHPATSQARSGSEDATTVRGSAFDLTATPALVVHDLLSNSFAISATIVGETGNLDAAHVDLARVGLSLASGRAG